MIESVVVACLVFVAYAATHPPAVATLGRLYDDVVYLSVGKSIAEGHGYRSAQLVATPVHVKFPPLLPAIYAIAWRTLGSLDAVAVAALWLNIVVTAACAGALWWLARRELDVGRIPAALFAIVPILADRTMFYFSGATSEPWMLLGWAAALILVRRLERILSTDGRGIGTAVALGLVMAATGLARTQGIAIGAAILLTLVLTRATRRVSAIAVASMVIPLAVWQVWHGAMMARGPLSSLPDQSGYTAWIPTSGVRAFASFATRMLQLSVPLYWTNTADVLTGWVSSKTLLLAAAVLLCGLVGVALVVRRIPSLAASLVVTLAVLLIWPYVQDRFLTPILPVLGLAGAYAMQRAIERWPRAFRQSALVGGVLAACALLAVNARTRSMSMQGAQRSPLAVAVSDIVMWVNQNTTPDEHVMVPWGGAIYLRTGRRTSIPNPEEPALGSAEPESLHLYAVRLRSDSVSDLIIWDRAPGRSAVWLRQLGAQCPGTLSEAAARSVSPAGPPDLHFYRVHADDPCIARYVRGEAGT
jgi:hypothetical protein